jgi:hypothetical protein
MAKTKIPAKAKCEITCNDEFVIEKGTPVVITHVKTMSTETWVTIRFKRKRTTTYFGMLDINNFLIED